MPRFIKLILLTIRDLLTSAGPSVILAVGLVAAAYVYLDPQPPKRVTLATGPDGSAYAGFGQRYAMALRGDGVEVELRPTEGAADNLRLLREGEVDLAFIRGGLADPVADEEAGLMSLGSLFYEPLWVFYRKPVVVDEGAAMAALAVKSGKTAGRPRSKSPAAAAPASAPTVATAAASAKASSAAAPSNAVGAASDRIETLDRFKGLRLSVDLAGSGVPEIVDKMLEANRIDSGDLVLSNLEPARAVDALLAGELDAVVLASAPESPLVQRLLRAPGIGLMDFAQSEAYTRLFPFLSEVSLPRGVVDLADDLPPSGVSMLAATTSLLSTDDTHPALRDLFARHAQRIHGGSGWFNRARDFPNTRTSELPVSPEGDRAINGSPPFWDRYLPFWASNLLERMWLVIGGLIVLLLPLSRIVPPLYTFQVRRRVFRWYARLREIESRMERGEGNRSEWLDEIDELDRVANGVTVPLSHAEELYALRSNIEKARRRLLSRAGGGDGAADDVIDAEDDRLAGDSVASSSPPSPPAGRPTGGPARDSL